TIFDYWGVPEHQKWMNGGKFDGDSLSLEQKQLRQVYSDLLNLAGRNPAITQGGYFDITEYNIKAGNFNDRVHAFVRYAGEERLLIITSFNTANLAIKVQLPSEVAETIGLKTDGLYIARDLLWREVEVGFDQSFTFQLTCKPFSSFVFKIK